jgi:hypothetical protein
MNQIYQGDVPIIRINEAPNVLFKELPSEGMVVRDGEITGHRHTVVARPESIVSIAKDDNGFYLKVERGGAVMTHPEHAQVEMGVGIYFIGEQTEYDELGERRVQD